MRIRGIRLNRAIPDNVSPARRSRLLEDGVDFFVGSESSLQLAPMRAVNYTLPIAHSPGEASAMRHSALRRVRDTTTCLAEAVELRRVVDQDPPPRRFVRRPFAEQVEQDRIVRLVLLGRMRPVAAPHHPFRACSAVNP